MIRRRGKARVRRTSLDCRSEEALEEDTDDKLPERSANGSSVKDLFWSNSMSSIGDL